MPYPNVVRSCDVEPLCNASLAPGKYPSTWSSVNVVGAFQPSLPETIPWRNWQSHLKLVQPQFSFNGCGSMMHPSKA